VAAGGFIVASRHNHGDTTAGARKGLWYPATGRVRILGTRIWIFGAYTPPSGRYSLLAWAPASREVARDDSLRITNTSTGTTVSVRSPLHHGFVASGAPAFSPGGTQMAVFVRTARLGSQYGMSQLAIVDTSTGALRLVPGTALDTTEDAFWSIWLPGSQRILAGAVGSAYVADARTLAVRRFTYFDSSTDGFSAVVLPAPRKT
jgi:WD40 repeat protein